MAVLVVVFLEVVDVDEEKVEIVMLPGGTNGLIP